MTPGTGTAGPSGGAPGVDGLHPAVVRFAEQVGTEGPVCAVGGRTHWDVGGLPAPGTREIPAPAGVIAHEPAEMTVRVLAGTTVAELDEVVGAAGQMVPLDPPSPGSTVGGVLAVGRSGVRRLRWGPVRDTVLQIRYVSADGRVITAGGPTVKNVSGFDLCRVLVGSLGTLGLIAEVLLRCRPRPAVSTWWECAADPWSVRARLWWPSSVLWDGQRTRVLLEGHPDDVRDEVATLGRHVRVTETGPPELPGVGRLSVPPERLRTWTPSGAGPWVAEIGVGVVHTGWPVPRAAPSGPAAEVGARLKRLMDPTGRCNPGRTP